MISTTFSKSAAEDGRGKFLTVDPVEHILSRPLPFGGVCEDGPGMEADDLHFLWADLSGDELHCQGPCVLGEPVGWVRVIDCPLVDGSSRDHDEKLEKMFVRDGV